MTRPYKVGLTGGIGSGKSLVSELFSRLGVPVLDADDIVRELSVPGSPVMDEIINIFGNNIIDTSGNLNRSKLRHQIFSDEGLRNRLESIIHPHVFDMLNSKISEITSSYCILSIPLLLETGSQEFVDTILVIDCPVSLQVDRVCKRDGLSVQEVNNIINTQIPRVDRLDAANEVIVNDGDLKKVSDKVMELHLDYSKRSPLDRQ
jgi:dephospho-CoA kinase